MSDNIALELKRLSNLKVIQVKSLKNVLPKALNYHFSNFKSLEKMAHPDSLIDGKPLKDFASHFESISVIKFEIQAYISQLRRIKHFINSVKLKEPTDPDLKEVWDAIMNEEGMVNMFANKWAVHRSFDDPRGEDELIHAEVLMNLEGGVTMWQGEHLLLNLGKHEFDLCSFHPKAERFIEWVFDELHNRQLREKEEED